MTTKEQLIEILKELLPVLAERFSVKRIGLFGSYARSEASAESDVDLIVDLLSPTFDNYMDLKFLLEDQLGLKVDLVMADTVKPRLSKYISREVVYVT